LCGWNPWKFRPNTEFKSYTELKSLIEQKQIVFLHCQLKLRVSEFLNAFLNLNIENILVGIVHLLCLLKHELF